MMRTVLALLLVAVASVSAAAQSWEMSGFAAFTLLREAQEQKEAA